MGIIEFGTAGDSSSKTRGIVPAEERQKAREDAADGGIGFLYDDRRLNPSKVEMFFPSEAPRSLTESLQEYFDRWER